MAIHHFGRGYEQNKQAIRVDASAWREVMSIYSGGTCSFSLKALAMYQVSQKRERKFRSAES